VTGILHRPAAASESRCLCQTIPWLRWRTITEGVATLEKTDGFMSSSYIPLSPAAPLLDERGAPYSPLYGDVYHNVSDALGQAHHVFLSGNGLPQRWRARDSFNVCETGFGLGLNFLTLWQTWHEDPDRCARLHYVSLEAHPCERQVLADPLRRVMPAAMRAQVDQLIEQWPPLLSGMHRLEFEEGALTLTLGFGLTETLAAQLSARVDTYF
jgi:tRNA 5-methylaminomethyl-2-thiouridine biosynthesis bifunctional protein